MDLYKVINNNHYANGLIAWSRSPKPSPRATLWMRGWDIVWFGNSYPNTVGHWKLDIERDLPVHGNIRPYTTVIELLKKQTRGAEVLCARVETAQFNLHGCPSTMTMEKY
jgi:hypothetical protein